MTKSSNKIALLTCLWKRPEVSHLFLSHYKKYKNLQIYAAVSSTEDGLVAKHHGIRFMYVANSPLSKKWQACLNFALNYGHKYYCTMGSDDFISESFFEQIEKECKQGKAIGLRDLMLYDVERKEMGLWRSLKTVGCGRVFSQDFLKMMDNVLWDQDVDQGIEGVTEARIKKKGLTIEGFLQKELSCLAIDVKTKDNIWGYSNFERHFIEKVSVSSDIRHLLKMYNMEKIMQLR